VEALILVVVLRRRIGGFDLDFGLWLSKIVMATGIMALVAELVAPKLDEVTSGDAANRLIQFALLSIAVGACAVTYFLAAWLLGVPEARNGMGKARSRVRRLARIG